MYNGEVNIEKLDNWVRQIEVYCMIQKIDDYVTKIQLASLHLESETLIWWEARTQEILKKSGKIISSWNYFIATLRMNFYPLAYMKKAIMDWKIFRQDKGQSVQSYTQEFRRIYLILGFNLSSKYTLLKYVGGLHSYFKHTILMFNPTNLDEVYFHTTHLESRGKNVPQKPSKKPSKFGDKGKGNFKGNGKKNATVKKEGEKLTCKHYSK